MTTHKVRFYIQKKSDSVKPSGWDPRVLLRHGTVVSDPLPAGSSREAVKQESPALRARPRGGYPDCHWPPRPHPRDTERTPQLPGLQAWLPWPHCSCAPLVPAPHLCVSLLPPGLPPPRCPPGPVRPPGALTRVCRIAAGHVLGAMLEALHGRGGVAFLIVLCSRFQDSLAHRALVLTWCMVLVLAHLGRHLRPREVEQLGPGHTARRSLGPELCRSLHQPLALGSGLQWELVPRDEQRALWEGAGPWDSNSGTTARVRIPAAPPPSRATVTSFLAALCPFPRP